MKRKRKRGWKSGGGVMGRKIETVERDHLGRAAITNQQRKVIEAIGAAIREQGWPPTMRELCGRFGWSSPSAAYLHLRYLERKGWIVRMPNQARAIRVVQ